MTEFGANFSTYHRPSLMTSLRCCMQLVVTDEELKVVWREALVHCIYHGSNSEQAAASDGDT